MAYAAGCAGTSDLLSRCGWLLWRVGWVCCFKGASPSWVLTWLWPLSCPCLFSHTWCAAAPMLVPLSIRAVLSWGQSVRVPGDLGPRPCVFFWGVACLSHCTCLLVSVPLCLYPVSALSSVDSSVPEFCESASGSSLDFRITNVQNRLGWSFDPGLAASSEGQIVPVPCPCFPAYSARLRWVGRRDSTWQDRRRQAVSRLGLPMHSLLLTELEHCFAVLYL